MGRIVKMDDALANKIAAGEVVERPASVVKELIENAIDAEADAITVEAEEGGLALIKVTDNGSGFAPDDLETAFERHATSKIRTEADLFTIKTLGFRGEALPSIASVSKVVVTSCDGVHDGRIVSYQGGHLISSGYAESRQGTEIAVTELFYNTPARLKHVKTIHTELGKISDCINKQALSHPEVRFTLIHNGKTMMKTNGNGDPAQVLAAIYGLKTAKLAVPFHNESLDFKISGRLVRPEVNRSGRQYVYIFINGRYIRHYGVFDALLRGYKTLLPIGRYPLAVIHIEMDPTLIDVNVHPAKLEARLSKEQELFMLIENTVRETFRKDALIPSGAENKTARPKAEKPRRPDYVQGAWTFNQPDPIQQVKETNELNDSHEPDLAVDQTESKQDLFENDTDPEQSGEGSVTSESAPEPATVAVSKKRMPEIYPIGQLHGTYILAQNDEGFYMIDQHAAEERINYEYFRARLEKEDQELQELLIPLTFDLTIEEHSLITRHEKELADIGLHFEPFGGRTMVVRSCPRWFPKGEEEALIRELFETLLNEQTLSVRDLRHDQAALKACKKSVKANRHLRRDEMEVLIRRLGEARDPFTCPHGRPVMIHYSTYEIEKMFKRVM